MKEKTRSEPNRIHAVGLWRAAAQWLSRGTSLVRASLRNSIRVVPDQLRSPKWSCSARAARLPARRGGLPHPPRRTTTRWQPVTVWLRPSRFCRPCGPNRTAPTIRGPPSSGAGQSQQGPALGANACRRDHVWRFRGHGMQQRAPRGPRGPSAPPDLKARNKNRCRARATAMQRALGSTEMQFMHGTAVQHKQRAENARVRIKHDYS